METQHFALELSDQPHGGPQSCLLSEPSFQGHATWGFIAILQGEFQEFELFWDINVYQGMKATIVIWLVPMEEISGQEN